MSTSSTVGIRLKAERILLNMSQQEMAVRGGVSKRTQISFETGRTSPNAEYLGRVAQHGVDVLFVVTGIRSKGV
ncbi:MAG: helix-turn-helix transcriptional regulator [Rudaea sp.]|uniref:helix-turn-helix domain-containing protein n=1 Tax=unclassified Rudaea TaxID=2627037 RepID=UPI0010F54E2F|nr:MULTISPECIES: helix-turn-helix transcriptional regulator [unclassified Rudaea]MBN8885932.1 helix-turn-helix transcriptional regulator [Rudaea sp.]MBR0347005.1 helix-turn-helix transcriptional regulator [Rudaea sp.]